MSGADKTHLIPDRWGRIRNIDVCSEAEPTKTWPYMMWVQPSTQRFYIRNKENTGWLQIGGGGDGGGPHAETHEDGGDDEIGVAGLSGELADPQTPKAHKTSHQDTGMDEINVGGLSGELADPQSPKAHATDHENEGGDEISVAGLSGVLADPQNAGQLQGRDVSDAAPNDEDVLTWDDDVSEWVPAVGGGGGGIYVDRGDVAEWDLTHLVATIDGNWHDFDMSSIISDTSAFLVQVTMEIRANAANKRGILRKEGFENEANVFRLRSQVANTFIAGDGWIPVDESQTIEYLADVGCDRFNVVVRGWWKPG